MNIGHMTLRIARWSVIIIAAVNVAVAITSGMVGGIVNIVSGAVCYLLLIELSRFAYRAASFCFGAFRGSHQNAGTVVRPQMAGPQPSRTAENYQPSKPMFNATTGWPMVGICDADGCFYGESEHD